MTRSVVAVPKTAEALLGPDAFSLLRETFSHNGGFDAKAVSAEAVTKLQEQCVQLDIDAKRIDLPTLFWTLSGLQETLHPKCAEMAFRLASAVPHQAAACMREAWDDHAHQVAELARALGCQGSVVKPGEGEVDASPADALRAALRTALSNPLDGALTLGERTRDGQRLAFRYAAVSALIYMNASTPYLREKLEDVIAEAEQQGDDPRALLPLRSRVATSGALPKPIASAVINAQQPFEPPDYVSCTMAFDPPVTLMGQKVARRGLLGRVLHQTKETLFVRLAHLLPQALGRPRFIGRFERVDGTFQLDALRDETEIDATTEPPWAMLHPHVLAVRLFDNNGDAPEQVADLANIANGTDLPAWIHRELGIAQASLGQTKQAIESLGKAIAAKCPKIDEAFAVRARLQLRLGELKAAEADIDGFEAVGNQGLHAAFLRGTLAASRGDVDRALEVLGPLLGERDAYKRESERYYLRDEDGKVIKADIGGIVSLGETPERDYDRDTRSDAARRLMIDALIGRGDHDQALALMPPLAPLKSGPDSLRMARIFAGLGRDKDAQKAYAEAAERGVKEATDELREMQNKKALRKPAPRPPASPDELDVDDRVLHKKFGEGTVADVDGDGPSAKITVEFDAGPTRTLNASFLERVSGQ